MNNKNLFVSTNSLSNTKSTMDSDCNDLLGMIGEYRKMFDETKIFYDTDSATSYRRLVNRYLDMVEKYIKDDFMPYVDNIDTIRKIYIEAITAISSGINGGGK